MKVTVTRPSRPRNKPGYCKFEHAGQICGLKEHTGTKHIMVEIERR